MSSNALYEVSDDESWSNELGPTDGYFSQRTSHPQDVLVPDPSQNSDPTNKAREAHQESEANATSEAGATLRRQSQATHHWIPSRGRLDPDFEDGKHTDISPLIPSAPPAYSAAPADRQYHSPGSYAQGSAGNTASRRYHTMGQSPIFLPDGHPIDFGEVPLLADTDHEGPARKRRARSCLPQSRRSCAISTVIFIALLIGVGFILSAFPNFRFGRHSKPGPAHPAPDSDEMPDNGSLFCPSATHTTRSSYHFLGHDFTFAEFVKTESEAGRRQVQTLSELHVRTSTQHLDIGTRLDLEIHYSEPGILKEFGFVPHEESLFMYTPSHVAVQTDSSPNPCMYFVATLWIAPRAQFDSVNIQTQSMAIFFHDGLTFEATSLAVDATGANSVAFPTGNSAETSIRSRRIVINSNTGAVHGTYPLYDLLEIKTSSGAVGIDVDPKEVLPSHPQPATLYVSTMSGSIHAQTAFIATDARKSLTAIVPARDYRTTITSMSGRIDTNLVHGSETTLTSKSGSIDAVLSPYGDPSDKSHIVTAAESGSTTVTVLPSLSNPGQPLRKLYAAYKCKTGSLSINYPREWEGTVQGTTVTGSINVHWPDLELGSGGGRRKIAWNSFKGVKGDGEGRVDFHTVTGSVTLHG